MKRFVFRLETLYKLRKEEERQALFVVQGLRQKEVFLLRQMSELSEERTSWVRRYNETGCRSGSAEELLLIEDYLIALEKQQRLLEKERQALEKEIKKALEAVQKAYKARRQVEFLREKQYESYLNDAKRFERKSFDEWNSMDFSRRSAGVYEGKGAGL